MGDLRWKAILLPTLTAAFFPGRLYLGIHDPEGLVSTIPAIGTGLLGILAGSYIKNSDATGGSKALRLAIAGIVFIGLALVVEP